MTDVVTFPCEYLVVNSGYTARLLQNEMLQEFSNFCARYGVIPLYIRDSIWGGGRVHPFAVQNGIIVPGVRAALPELVETEIMQLRLANNRLNDDGIIVFRVRNFQNATNVFTNIQRLEYCHWDRLMDMKFIRNRKDQIDIVYVEFENEFG
ncbi:Hypothetical protein HVR_LOCUS297 [uncultured virus]|nr:Hypothetical protein HVR_LOCUS297 [uncultured virus]